MPISRDIDISTILGNLNNFGGRLAYAMTVAMEESLMLLGNLSGTEFMIPQSGEVSNPVKLIWRSGKLAKSMISQPDGQMTIVPSSDKITGALTTFVKYAHRQEFGGTYLITPRQVKYFFYRFHNPGIYDPHMWLSLAMKGKKGGSIVTPPRPFFGPALYSQQLTEGVARIVKINFQKMLLQGR